MLFAAGFGTRMGTLTADQPKPMIKVAGKPLIDHALDLANAFEPHQIVVNLHYKPKALERHLLGADIALSRETPKVLETGGGLRAALPLLGSGPVFTMNTDVVWSGPNPLNQLADLWMPDQMDALLLCIPKPQALGHTGDGDFLINENNLARRGAGAIYSGLQIIKTDLLHDIPQQAFSLNLLWDEMLKNDRLFAVTYPGKWCDVGNPEGIKTAEDMLGYRNV